MKAIITKIALSLFAFIILIQIAQSQPITPANWENPVAEVQAELKALRLELLQQRIEFQEWKIKQLDGDLQCILKEQQQFQEHAQAISRQIAELDAQAAEPLVSQRDTIDERQAMKTALRDEEMRHIQAQLQPLSERAAELHRQLNQEQLVLQELLEKAKALKSSQVRGQIAKQQGFVAAQLVASNRSLAHSEEGLFELLFS